MYPLGLLLLFTVVFALLVQWNGVAAIVFLIAALIFVPALVLHRRELAAAPGRAPDSESHFAGVTRLIRIVGVDLSGISLGVLLLLTIVLVLAFVALPHVHLR